MNQAQINTGNDELDSDLKLLFRFDKSGELQRIEEAARSGQLTPQEFQNVVPDGLVRIAVVVSSVALFNSLLESSPQSSDALNSAKSIVEKKLQSFLAHPEVTKRVRKAAEGEHAARRPLGQALRVIAGTSHILTWYGIPPNIAPGVRIGFVGRNDELLFDTSLDWDDLFFVIQALMAIASQCLKSGLPLAECKLLETDTVRTLGRRVMAIENSLGQVRALAPKYGISFEPTPSASSEPNGARLASNP